MIEKDITGRGALKATALLTLLIVLVYSNSFDAAWHLDDHINILRNSNLHIDNLRPATLVNTLFDHHRVIKPQGGLYRPVACLSFALNWYFGQTRVFGYHIVNIALHVLTAVLLFFVIRALLNLPKLRVHDTDQTDNIALLASCLWAIHPIQTQAVTYVVQRMSVMAALFYLAGIFFYIHGRTCRMRFQRIVYYTAMLISYGMAVGSKENAVMLPLALFLIETLLLRDLTDPSDRKKMLMAAAAGVGMASLAGLFIMGGNPSVILQSYDLRPYTMMERLLTESRILVQYLIQIFYPNPAQLSIIHDIEVSKSLIHPVTTLFAILGLIGLCGVGFSQMLKRPMVAFAIFFFFLNHVIESSVLPLELMYEHRNYLPSLFLFVPVAAGCQMLIARLHDRKRYVFVSAFACVSVIIAVVGIGTYSRNMVWQTEQTLWQDVLVKAPGLARPYQQLAAIYDRQGRTGEAIGFYKHALKLKDPRPDQSRALSLNNLGNIYARQGKHEQAIQTFEKILVLNPGHARARYNMSLVLIDSGQFAQALAQARILAASQNDNVRFLNLVGFLHIHQGQPDKALAYLQPALRLSPESRSTLINLGAVLKDLGRHAKADWFLKRAERLYPGDAVIMIRLIENALLAGDGLSAAAYTKGLFKLESPLGIERLLANFQNDNRLLPIDAHVLKPYLAAEIQKQGAALVCPDRAAEAGDPESGSNPSF